MTALMDFALDTGADDAATEAAAGFEVRLSDGTTETVRGATAYLQEGQMTTFFRTAENDPVVDAWSERLASIRTTEIVVIRKPAPSEPAVPHLSVVAEAEAALRASGPDRN